MRSDTATVGGTSTPRAALRVLADAYGLRPMNDSPVGVVPLDELMDALEEDAFAGQVDQLSYECPPAAWGPLACAGWPVGPPRRFVDGSVFARTVGTFSIGGQLRPAILAAIGAMAVDLQDRTLRRTPASVHTETTLCLLAAGMPAGDLETLRAGLQQLGVQLEAPTGQDARGDFELLRRRTWDLAKARMEDAERAVLHRDPATPTLVDGLLERRLVRLAVQAAPAYGLVKTQRRQLLPGPLAARLLELQAGERTPAFVVATEHAELVTWYLRLTQPDGGAPNTGIVRLSATRAYLEQRFPDPAARFAELSAVSAWLRTLRCRDRSYPRAAVSLEPVVRLEQQLHALLPAINHQTMRLHRLLGR
jgi:hypothetical protein